MSETKELGRFGHHPDPAIDYCVEVEEIEAIWTDRCNKFANPDDSSLESRVRRAVMFRVGGDLHAINAKDRIRKIEADLDEEAIARIVGLQAAAPAMKEALEKIAGGFWSKGAVDALITGDWRPATREAQAIARDALVNCTPHAEHTETPAQ